jgi:hypothetical protein
MFTLAVMMLAEATSSMDDIKPQIAKEKASARKGKILRIVSLVMLFVRLPFLGEAGATAAGFAGIVTIFADIGIAANAGLGIYTIAGDPTMAPLELIGILLGGRLRGIRGASGPGSLEAVAAKLGASVRTAKLSARGIKNGDTVDLIMSACKKVRRTGIVFHKTPCLRYTAATYA